MAAYWLWRGVDGQGQECQGLKQCDNRLLLQLQLSQQGIDLINSQRVWFWHRRWPKRIAAQHLQQLLQQWSQLMAAGLPLLMCLQLTQVAKAPMRIKIELVNIQQSLLRGASFADAIALSGLFSSALEHLIAAGEASGELPQLLAQTHCQLMANNDLKRRFLRTMIMPGITLFSGVLVSLLIVYWVVPQVANLYASANYGLPRMTQWLLLVVEFLRHKGWVLLVLTTLFSVVVMALWSLPRARLCMEMGLWRLPGVGPLMHLHGQAELYLLLNLTFNAGVSLLEAIALAGNASSWRCISRDLDVATVKLKQGQRLSQVFASVGVPQHAVQMIRMGEASGHLGTSFNQLQGYYLQQAQSHSLWLEQLIEPVLLLLVSVFVGGILVALYLPLLQMGQVM